MRKSLFHISATFLIATAMNSCSTTRVLADGEYRLAVAGINVANDSKWNSRELDTYIRQKPGNSLFFGWNPFMSVYNWSAGRDSTFFGRICRKIGTPPVIYSSEMTASSVDNISRHLEYLGYYGSKVDTTVAIKRKNIKVRYDVTLGKRYSVRGITYQLPDNDTFAEDFCRDTSGCLVKRGDFLSESTLEAESQRSAAKLRDCGYYGFSRNYYFFRADTLSYPGEALLEYRINEYTRNESPRDAARLRKYEFGQVSISYPENFRIREKVIRDLNTVHPGDLYRESAVNNAYSRLSSISVLSGVNVDVHKADSSLVDADIRLTPSRLQGFKFNMEASSNSSGLLGLSPGLSYYHRNIFKGGEVLNLNFMGNFQFKPNRSTRSTELGVSAGIRFPRFVFIPVGKFRKSIPSTEIKASYNYQDRPEYKRNIISTSFGYSGQHRKLYYQFYPLQLNIVRLFSIDQSFYSSLAGNPFMRNAYQNHFDLGMGGTLYYTTNADVTPRSTYHYFRLQTSIAGNFLSLFKTLMDKDDSGAGMIWNTPYSQYVRSEFTAGKTWIFGKNDKQAFATRLLVGAGAAYGNSRALPFEQHFYSGGANSLRGWQARSVGPGMSAKDSTFVIPNQTGDMKLEANAEYRFGVFWKFDGALFIDAGNVWTLHDTDSDSQQLGKFTASNFLKGIAIDWGLGLRLDLNFILVRLDMGMILRDPSVDAEYKWRSPDKWLRNDGFSIHFGVGYPF